MKHTITVDLSERGIDRLIKKLDEYEKWMNRKVQEFVNRLAQEGVQIAQIGFSSAQYDGTNDVTVTVENRGETVAAVVATGKAVLFIEFGAGYLMGYGHPEPMEYGPGTYPGKGHWDDPDGWYFAHGQKSYGNPPAAAMYNARKELEQRLTDIAKEVFA